MPLKLRTSKLERAAAALKRRLAVLEKANKQLRKQLAKTEAAVPAPEKASRAWFTGKGIRSLRRKTGLTQADFAKLVGVTAQAVYNWEKKPDLLKLRSATKAALLAIRGIGVREARQRLKAKRKK